MKTQAAKDLEFLHVVEASLASGMTLFSREFVRDLFYVASRERYRFEWLAMDLIDDPRRLERMHQEIRDRSPDGLVTPELIREAIEDADTIEVRDGT